MNVSPTSSVLLILYHKDTFNSIIHFIITYVVYKYQYDFFQHFSLQ